MKGPEDYEAENIAAISACFHGSEFYGDFYRDHGADLGGFPGIWSYMVDAGQAFTVAETKWMADGEEWDGEWIDAIEDFTDSLLENPPIHDRERLAEIAARAIAGALEKHNPPEPEAIAPRADNSQTGMRFDPEMNAYWA